MDEQDMMTQFETFACLCRIYKDTESAGKEIEQRIEDENTLAKFWEKDKSFSTTFFLLLVEVLSFCKANSCKRQKMQTSVIIKQRSFRPK